LLNTNTENLVTRIDSALTFLIWIKDSAILFQKEKDKNIEFWSYQIGENSFSLLDSNSNDSNWKATMNSDFISFPNTVDSYKDAFFVFMRGVKLLRYNFFKKEVKEILAIDIPRGFQLNNITVNNDCSTLLFSSRSVETGMISAINLDNKRLKIVDRGVSLKDESSFVYFLQRQNESLYYKVINRVDNIATMGVYLYNLKTESKIRIATVKCVSLINPFEICSRKLLVINNVNPPGFNLQIQNTLLNDLFNALMGSLSFIEIKLPKNLR
jgi:hypothetical protein